MRTVKNGLPTSLRNRPSLTRAIQRALRPPFLERCGKEEGNGKLRGVEVTVLSPRPPELRTANFELLIALFSPVSRFARYQDAGGLFQHLLRLLNRLFDRPLKYRLVGLYIKGQ